MNFYSLLSIQNNCSMFIIPLSLLHSECPVYLKKLTSVSWLLILLLYGWTSLVAQTLKNLPAMQETWVWSLVRKISWKREWLSTPVFLPGQFHGQRSLLGYSSWGCKELDMTSMSNFFFWLLNSSISSSLICTFPMSLFLPNAFLSKMQ